MKKICMLLAVVLTLMALGTCALAAEGDAVLGHEQDYSTYFNYCFADNDVLYLIGYNEFYTYHIGDADMKSYEIVFPDVADPEDCEISIFPFASDGQLYAISLVTRLGEYSEFLGAALCTLTLDDTTVTVKTLQELDWSDLVEYYDDNSYATRPESVIGVSGKALMRCYDNNGDGVVYLVDLETASIEAVDALTSPYALTAYGDGKLLVEEYSFEASNKATFVIYDVGDGSVQPLSEIEIEDYNPLQGLAYDPSTDTVYCVKGGEVCPVDLASGSVGEGLTDMPIEPNGNSSGACMAAPGYYVCCSEGAAIRNLDPNQKAQSKLKISDMTWNETISNTYYRFANEHGDISVVLSRDGNESINLIENMMNRDDSVDVYVLYSADTVFEALYNRGYLMELDGSEKVKALAERMYPSLRECLSSDGHLVALPLNMNAMTLGINEKVLSTLGYKIEDVPDNWSDFLDFLSGLEGAVAEKSGVHLFFSGYTAESVKYDIFNAIFDDYQRYVNLVDPTMGYNTELLRGLLKKLEQMDFQAFGLPTEEDLQNGDNGGYSDESVLIQIDTGCSIGNFYLDFTPVLLRVDPDTIAPITLETVVVVINPFTKNPDAALAFIDELVENLPRTTLYCVDPSQSEPYRGTWNEENMAEMSRMIEDTRKQLDTADTADKQMLEEMLKEYEQNLDDMEKNMWEISPAEIEWYRAHDDNVVISKPNWLYTDESGEASELIFQYQDGQIDLDQMLKGIDKKVQMMLMEGN